MCSKSKIRDSPYLSLFTFAYLNKYFALEDNPFIHLKVFEALMPRAYNHHNFHFDVLDVLKHNIPLDVLGLCKKFVNNVCVCG